MKHCACEDYNWNPSICACKCDKDCDISKCLKGCKCMKSLVDDVAVPFNEIYNTRNSAVINPSDGINYLLIVAVILAISCLLLLVTIVVNYLYET